MNLNLGSLSFNTIVESGGSTPSWGTELGQSGGYYFNVEDQGELFTSLVYTAVPDLENVFCPLGKGGNQAKDYEFVIAGLYNKVYVNNIFIEDAQFLLLVIKKIAGDNHINRRTIKYSPRIKYRGQELNRDCFKKIESKLGLDENSSWFIDEINTFNQDELHFTAYVLNPEHKCSYPSAEERKIAYLDCINANRDKELKTNRKLRQNTDSKINEPLQIIVYGAPGTGKSHSIEEDIANYGMVDIRTTFHPDTDYSTFVGVYKPRMKKVVIRDDRGFPVLENGDKVYEQRIVYDYTKQAFLKAYITAWKNINSPHVLVIEEINRGNCAQIFGDLFQLLDRNTAGYSKYPIVADSDIADLLKEEFSDVVIRNENLINSYYHKDVCRDIIDGKLLVLPNNLYIWATMNTSDQSLFPIDSAFKRRWEWKYIPIVNAKKNWVISVNGAYYDWWEFINKINQHIWETTNSEDKKLGYFFCIPDGKKSANDAENNVISADRFTSKVLFYIFNDVFKDYGFEEEIFHDNENDTVLSFQSLFMPDGSINQRKVQKFMTNLDLIPVSEASQSDKDVEDAEEENSDITSSVLEEQNETFHDGTEEIEEHRTEITNKDVPYNDIIDEEPEEDKEELKVEENEDIINSSNDKSSKEPPSDSIGIKIKLNNKEIPGNDLSEIYINTLRQIGLKKIADNIAEKEEFRRLGCPYVSYTFDKKIESSSNFKLKPVDNLYVLLGINKKSIKSFLEYLANEFALNLEIE